MDEGLAGVGAVTGLVAQLAVKRRLVVHAHGRLERAVGVCPADLRILDTRADNKLAVGSPVVRPSPVGERGQRIKVPGILYKALGAGTLQA